MSEIVVDASVVVRALLPQQDPQGEAAAAMRALLAANTEPLAPSLFAYEIGSVSRRLGATSEVKAAFVARALQIVRLVGPTPEGIGDAAATADATTLSFYDATYVALARRLQAPLWTEDQEILRRAKDVAIDTRRAGDTKRY